MFFSLLHKLFVQMSYFPLHLKKTHIKNVLHCT